MAKDALASDDLAKKFATEKDTPYRRWVIGEGLDIIGAHYVADLNTVELKPWPRRGGRGVYVNHEASRTSNDCYVCEIPPGRELAPQRQLFEEMIYILDGSGSTTVWNDGGARITFEWGKGSMFAIPLNAWHQHFNGSGRAPARYVAVTNSPGVINLYEDPEFVFNTRHDFTSRFNGEPDYFANRGVQKGLLLETNFVADAINLPLVSAKERGAGGGHIRFNLAKGSMNCHISQFPIGTYKKAHAHGPGAHVIILSGEGYSLMWPEGAEPQHYEWRVGLDGGAAEHVVPPAFQHRHHPGALSRLQARGGGDPEHPGRAQGVDQPAPGRRPDRLCGRAAAGAQPVRRGAQEARAPIAHGRSLRVRNIRGGQGTARRGGRGLSTRPKPLEKRGRLPKGG